MAVMKERHGGPHTFKVGPGTWGEQSTGEASFVGDEASSFGRPRWWSEIEHVVASPGFRASVVVIDTTAASVLLIDDIGFLVRLSERLRPIGLRVIFGDHVQVRELCTRMCTAHFQTVAPWEKL